MATATETTRVRAVAKNIQISPQKVRLVIDQIRGKRVNEALAILRFLPQGAANEVARVVRSAAANAEHNNDMDPDDLVVALAFADEGLKLKRFTARARGRPGPIIKRFSHITVVVEEKPQERRRPAARGAAPARRGAGATNTGAQSRGRSQTPNVTAQRTRPLVGAGGAAPVATVGEPPEMPLEASDIVEETMLADEQPRVPARAHAPGEIEIVEPPTAEEKAARAEAADERQAQSPQSITGAEARAEADEIANAGMAQPMGENDGEVRRNDERS